MMKDELRLKEIFLPKMANKTIAIGFKKSENYLSDNATFHIAINYICIIPFTE